MSIPCLSPSRQSVLYRFGVWVSPEEYRILGYFLIRRHACQARQSIQFETVRWRCSRLEMWTLFHELHAMVSLLSLGNGLVHYGSVAVESPRDSCHHASPVHSACGVPGILTVINTTEWEISQFPAALAFSACVLLLHQLIVLLEEDPVAHIVILPNCQEDETILRELLKVLVAFLRQRNTCVLCWSWSGLMAATFHLLRGHVGQLSSAVLQCRHFRVCV